ncbi:hypothetical protein HYDPIDRAFT_43926 [Hydnomerulius pinastri MD-312]|uniref:Unplaced genomic scaffold scaffold_50, whole genome shotgun sequence n=1 Tax=Hydnomerulius pinastri MD-312 TaxID=994086 RepID=A0A0C9W8W7_9AGAM|nr:hypothetical protein HYDPIDRAFT_43926 [Hydnomerulius pinastri MD-312]
MPQTICISTSKVSRAGIMFGHVMEMQYWKHCELFPDSLLLNRPASVPQPGDHSPQRPLVDELKQTILHASGDILTSATSLTLFDKDELTKLLELTTHLKENLEGGDPSPHAKAIVARLMEMFARARSSNFHGQVGARLDIDRTVYRCADHRRSILLRFISWTLFFAPNVHLGTLKTIWVDQTINYISWTKFLAKLGGEWQELVLYATVILNANVAFLAIPGVSPTTPGSGPQTGAQIFSYISVSTSLGAVVTGLRLMRQTRTKRRETAGDAAAFMMRMSQSAFGTETIAILTVSFIVAFCILIFNETDLVTRIPVGFSGLIVVAFTLWTIFSAYGEEEPETAEAAPGIQTQNKTKHQPPASPFILQPQIPQSQPTHEAGNGT